MITPDGSRVLSEVRASLFTALSIAHHEMPDHTGLASDCTRPLCHRLRADADALGTLIRTESA